MDPETVDSEDRPLTLTTGALVLACVAALVLMRLAFTGAVAS